MGLIRLCYLLIFVRPVCMASFSNSMLSLVVFFQSVDSIVLMNEAHDENNNVVVTMNKNVIVEFDLKFLTFILAFLLLCSCRNNPSFLIYIAFFTLVFSRTLICSRRRTCR